MTQSLAVVVTSAPTSNLSYTAFKIVEQAIQSNITVTGVFFYQDGVLNASKYLAIPSDELQIISLWKKLNQQNQVPLHLCSTAAEKRGLIFPDDDNFLIHPEFTLSGLGELVMLTNQADRLVQL
ncbi:sulfurtransferase complex subunit TusD [Thalassotalea profundi]|uniref:Sulfurtransferase TusD n=1 Tax=Thalassotalea profundi TaxID=2036687 RepID=A0ABQ3IJ07_9GAMM|nr:sulfurtransferase complex subunit TusD [Thalassotalea profundi]GHE83167.1 sulfurtransferase TusD [Thalassotalea profundi]